MLGSSYNLPYLTSCLPLVHIAPAAPKAFVGFASLACILFYMVWFAIGAGPLPFLVLPEILPQEIMGTAQVRFC
jgi:hypothetical protein